jgi:hypothetical protein
MDAHDHGFLLVLPRSAYFVVGHSRMVIKFLGMVPMAAAVSSPGTYMTSSPAANAASPDKPSEAIAQQVAWLATAVAVADGTSSAVLCKALLAAFH